MERLISFFGLFVMLFLAWLMSSHKRRVPWRIIFCGITLQFLLALLILRTEPGFLLFDQIGKFFSAVMNFVDQGSKFVFGPNFTNHYFAFKVLPTIIFFSSLMSVLYYLGVIQVVVRGFAWVMQRTLKTSGAESLSASANIFMGQTEAPMLVKPFIGKMTNSELNAVMIGGFATVSGGVLALFAGMGIDAKHLVTASVIAAPAGLMIAKIMLPETEVPVTSGETPLAVPQTAANVIEAAANGASDGVKLAINVAAMLIAFLGLLAMCDALLGLVGARFGMQWSIGTGLGYLFAPLAWCMGIDSADCLRAGELLGKKMVATEIVAYEQMLAWKAADSGVALQERTVTLMSYALCGFANFASIGIQIGGLGGMAPERQADLARLGLRAMLGGTLATCMSACVAGVVL